MSSGIEKTQSQWLQDFRAANVYEGYEFLRFFKKQGKKQRVAYFEIRCKECGNVFERQAATHKRGTKCRRCTYLSGLQARRSKASWIKEFNRVHDPRQFKYLGYEFRGSAYFTIECQSCGHVCERRAADHAKGRGCSRCSGLTKPEKLIGQWLKSQGIDFIHGPEFSSLPGHVFDFYLSEYETIIEYDGEWHYLGIVGEERLRNRQKQDAIKDEWCAENFVNLIRIPYFENLIEVLELEVGGIVCPY